MTPVIRATCLCIVFLTLFSELLSSEWEKDKDFICQSCHSFTYNRNGCDVEHCDCVTMQCVGTLKKPTKKDRKGIKAQARKDCCKGKGVTLIKPDRNLTMTATGKCQSVPRWMNNDLDGAQEVNSYGSCVTLYDEMGCQGSSVTIKENGPKKLSDVNFRNKVSSVRSCIHHCEEEHEKP